MIPSASRAGIVVIVAAIVTGPFLSLPEYSSIRHTTSELAGQGMPSAWVMRAGFLAFGAGVLVDAGRRLAGRDWAFAPAVLFGCSMILTAVFSNAPIDRTAPFDATADGLHSVFSGLVGLSFALGALAVLFRHRRARDRIFDLVAIAASVGLPLVIFGLPGVAGLAQRAMFAISFVWFWKYLPPDRAA